MSCKGHRSRCGMMAGEGGGDSVEAARPVPTRTWTVSVKAPPSRAPDTYGESSSGCVHKKASGAASQGSQAAEGRRRLQSGAGAREGQGQRVAAPVDAVASVFVPHGQKRQMLWTVPAQPRCWAFPPVHAVGQRCGGAAGQISCDWCERVRHCIMSVAATSRMRCPTPW